MTLTCVEKRWYSKVCCSYSLVRYRHKNTCSHFGWKYLFWAEKPKKNICFASTNTEPLSWALVAGLAAFWSSCSSITIPSTWKTGMKERYKHIIWMRCDRYCTNVIMVHVACTNMDESVVCRNVINQIFYYGHWLCKITFHALVSHWHLYTFCPFLINLYIVDIMSWWGPAEMHYYSGLSG